MSIEKYNCTRHAIAYIDLLGIKREMDSDQNKCLKNMAKALFFANQIKKGSDYFEFLRKLKTKAFSDNIVFAIEITEEIDTETALAGVTVATYFFQRMLIQECHYLSRGAITVGDLYIDDTIVWGKGLVRAYQLENDIAIFPRVIMDSQVMLNLNFKQLSEKNRHIMVPKIEVDFDDNFYVNYSHMSIEDLKKFIVDLDNTCQDCFVMNDKVIQKLSWLQRMKERIGEKIKTNEM